MNSVTFAVSPEVGRGKRRTAVNHAGLWRKAIRRPIEAIWTPTRHLTACGGDHALLTAIHDAFFLHYPLQLTPDVIWLTLARGFALHVNLHAEELRHRFVRHEGREKLVVERLDFLPGQENPWPEAFEAFSDQIGHRVGRIRDFVRADFSTTGAIEQVVSDLMVMDSFQAYFEYEMMIGCGIPQITLMGTADDWKSIRSRAALFGEFGLEAWSRALDPVLVQFVAAAEGNADQAFWKSMFRYNSGSGTSVMTGWINVLFPYLRKSETELYPNPYLDDWRKRLEIDDRQHWRTRWHDPQGVGMGAVPPCLTWIPVKMSWDRKTSNMRFIGGLMGVSQDEATLALRPECGWVIAYESPVDESPVRQFDEIVE